MIGQAVGPSVDAAGQVRVAYLCSTYPAVSHTFILREVQALRDAGLDIQTFSVRRTVEADLMSAADVREAALTRHLLPTSPGKVLAALFRLLRGRRGLDALRVGVRRAWQMRRPGVRSALWQAFYLAEAILLWADCSRLSIRHIHAHFANAASDVALLASAVGTVHDPGAPWTWSLTMHGPAEFWNVDHHRVAAKATDASFVACISDFARSQLMAITDPTVWPSFEVVHCGLDAAAYGRAADADGENSDELRLVSVGRLVPVKGQLLIVDLVYELRARGLDVRAEIFGAGPARETIRQRISDHGLDHVVALPGPIGQDELPAKLHSATVFVLPSFAEGLPVVLIEAMALGVPVVASRIAGVPELIQDGVSGLLTTPSRLDELVEVTERLLSDSDLRREIAAAASERVAEHFNVTTEADKLVTLFKREIMSQPGISQSEAAVPR